MQTLINQVTNLRQTRASLSEKYQKGIITSDELHLLDAIDDMAQGIIRDIAKERTPNFQQNDNPFERNCGFNDGI